MDRAVGAAVHHRTDPPSHLAARSCHRWTRVLLLLTLTIVVTALVILGRGVAASAGPRRTIFSRLRSPVFPPDFASGRAGQFCPHCTIYSRQCRIILVVPADVSIRIFFCLRPVRRGVPFKKIREVSQEAQARACV